MYSDKLYEICHSDNSILLSKEQRELIIDEILTNCPLDNFKIDNLNLLSDSELAKQYREMIQVCLFFC